MTWDSDLRRDAPNMVLADRIVASIGRLFSEDRHLLLENANERSISHRLGLHLTAEFPKWDVDCEFNRDGHDPKRLNLETETLRSDDDKGVTVYPDIVVHKRGRKRNLLVIEIKKDSAIGEAKDLEKLRAFREQLSYAYGLFLCFGTADQAGAVKGKWR